MTADGRIQAGLLRVAGSILTYTSAFDHGNETRTYATLAAVRGNLEFLTGRERESAQQVSASAEYSFEMRYSTAIKAKMQLVIGSRTFEIVAPPTRDEMRHRWTKLLLREINPA